VAEVLLRCASDSIKQAPDLPPRPPPDGDKGEMMVSKRKCCMSVVSPTYTVCHVPVSPIECLKFKIIQSGEGGEVDKRLLYSVLL